MTYDFDFSYIWSSAPALLDGFLVTLQVTMISIALAVFVGAVGAIARVLEIPILSHLVVAYVNLVRNTPLLVQIFFIFYGLPTIGIGLSLFHSGVVALVVWGGAYNVENIRGGFLAVPKGLHEAANSLGLRPLQYMWLIAIPLGLRVSLPAVLNTSISVLKNSAYLQAIGLAELTFVAMTRIAMDFRTLEMFAVIGLLYLALVLSLSLLVRRIEQVMHRPFRS